MKKKILIPTDFSKYAWNAITYAADLFKDKECAFYLLHAFLPATYETYAALAVGPGTPAYENAKEKSEEGLKKVMDMLGFRETNKLHSYTVISDFNDPITAMDEVIEKRDIELVVMGTKGNSNIRTNFFGSTTITAMEKLRNCPILGIPLDSGKVQVKEIVFPTSYKTHYKRRELIHMVELAQIQDANICILYVSESSKLSKEQKENKVLLEQCLEGASFSAHHIGGLDTTSGVNRFVESRNSDMIAFINRKHSFLTRLLSTPMVKELGMLSKVPFLAMHDLRN